MYGIDDAGEPLSDEALLAEIAAYRKAIREVTLGSGISVVAGEGRRVEFVRSNIGDAQTALRELLRIARDRNLPIGGTGQTAIAVEIG